ncbi:aminotransferase class I/II-fold pyridoxal phosphate-dependent enzyme [Defluviitalea phaphyphila]|uniref:aminotransferase class I/II-fold pyridoxal phosphate-dependent enzyme n=1 Tax=Defluviitalea phaphyphila TaxID=1473580 RepID=UPI000731BD5D|nr:aminotransferase class V-fold PLP-dependent enzyme [Defluviitalea phaphyphila]
MIKAPLYEKLINYYKEGIYPFHMPGHKLGRGLENINLFNLDVTEIPGMDNLYEAKEVIAKAENLMAKTFGADETIFLVNGSTTGVIASILGVTNPKDEIIIARNSHHSAYNAMILGDVIPHYINPNIIKSYGLLGGISPKDIEEKLIAYPNSKAVFITSPTYEGFTSDIKEIAYITHKYNKILIVDEAHGAHFNFHSKFPKTALEKGADIVIQSLHKTLPALTQTALMHFKGDRVNKNKVKQIIRMIQTSSPSYIFMGMMDLLRSKLEKSENYFNEYINRLDILRNNFNNKLNNIIILGKELNGKYGIKEIDISRLVFYTGRCNKSGTEIDEILRHKYKIQMELSSPIHLVGITSISDTKEGFHKLEEAMFNIDKKLRLKENSTDIYNIINPSLEIEISPREAFYSPRKIISLDKAKGEISANFVVFYPPGIPLLSPGEKITKFHIEQIKKRTKEDIIEIIERGVI